jgi:hypothetical protein
MFRRAVIACLALMLVVAAAAARSTQAPNSRVTLDLPAGFTPASRYAGFEHTASGASFVILEAPAHAYEQMAAGFTPEGLATRGVTNAVKGQLTRVGEHVYMRAEQATPLGLFDKLFVVFRASDITVLVTASVPRSAVQKKSIDLAAIESALASARVVEARLDRPLFTLGYTGPLKSAGAIMGSGLLFTRDGKMEAPQQPGPPTLFILAPSLDRRQILDIGPFAERALTTVPGVGTLQVTAAQSVEIAGLAGIRHEAKGASDPDGTPVRVMQIVLAGKDGGYVRMIGIAPDAEASQFMPEFVKMAASLKPGY